MVNYWSINGLLMFDEWRIDGYLVVHKWLSDLLNRLLTNNEQYFEPFINHWLITGHDVSLLAFLFAPSVLDKFISSFAMACTLPIGGQVSVNMSASWVLWYSMTDGSTYEPMMVMF